MRSILISLIVLICVCSCNQNSSSSTAMATDTATAKKEVAGAEENMFNAIDHKLFDHTIKLFGIVGICNGRAQFLMQNKRVAEIFYTAIFRKENGNVVV